MEVEYFAHKHPLILEKDYSHFFCFAHDHRLNRCRVCSLRLEEYPLGETSFYRCRDLGCDDNFYLHKSCAELPTKIEHLMHPDHPLTLRARLPRLHRYCNCCRVGVFNRIFYHCSQCQFNLCVKCALPIVLNLDYASHQHQPLIPLRMEASLFCEACGTEHRGIFYTCPTCIANSHSQFFIHRNCVSLPKTFQHSGHDHNDGDLILGYSIPPEYTQHNQYCKICLERVNPKYWVYYCGGCRYFVHINCATTTTISSDKEAEKTSSSQTEPCNETVDRVEMSILESIHLPVHESICLLSHLLKNMKLEDNERAETVKFNHFSHEHPLIFFNVQSHEDEELCSDSELSLLNKMNDGKCCVELPTMVEAPWHSWHCNSELFLIAKADTPFNLFLCECCKVYCNGLAYHCAICEFYIDVQCGLLPSAITHEGHHPQHLFQLTKESASLEHCSSCNYPSKLGYRCSMCNFFLDIRCALLPRTIKQKYDELHPFTLIYYPIKNHPQEYICEVCEQDLNPMKWFYHCIECDKSIHIGCTYLGERFRNVKFGGIFHTDHHEHQLTLVHKTKKPSKCNTCNGDIECDYVFHADSTLECSQCNFKMHLRCALKNDEIFNFPSF